MNNFCTIETLHDQEFKRYSRQIMLSDWQEIGQIRLKNSRVVIVGCGGLGNVVASYLAAAGVGQLTLIDGDEVELSNLHRQLAFDLASCGLNKASELMQRLVANNDEIAVDIHEQALDTINASELLANHDLVIDCTDNFSTRHTINRTCVEGGLVLLSGAVIGWQGQLMLINSDQDAGCYQCLYPASEDTQASCASRGVNPAMVGVVGSYQANQAMRYLLNLTTPLSNQLALIDGVTMDITMLARTQHQQCDVCTIKKMEQIDDQ